MASLAQISNAGATPTSLSGSRCATVAVVRLCPNPSSQATCHNLVWTSIKRPGMALQVLLARQCFANSVVDKYTRAQDYSEFNSLSRLASRNVITHSRQCRRKRSVRIEPIWSSLQSLTAKASCSALAAPRRLIRAWEETLMHSMCIIRSTNYLSKPNA